MHEWMAIVGGESGEKWREARENDEGDGVGVSGCEWEGREKHTHCRFRWYAVSNS